MWCTENLHRVYPLLVGTALLALAAAVVLLYLGRREEGGADPPDCIEIEGEPYRACPTSWWRSEHHNDEVGGAAHSNHLLGCAFDFVTDPPGHIQELHAWVTERLPLTWVEPLEESDTHVHVDWRCHQRGGG